MDTIESWDTLPEQMQAKLIKSIEQAELGLGVSAAKAIADMRIKVSNTTQPSNDSAANDLMTPQAK